MKRRDFLRTAGGAAGGAAAATTAAHPVTAAEDEGDGGGGGGGEPAFGDWFSDVGNYDGTVVDARGQEEVTVMVGSEGNGGNFAFDPPAVQVDVGTTVVWEWTGQGNQHNVVAETGGEYESDLTAEEGFTFEHTFEESGISQYYCVPHESLGMKGAVVVGEDYPTAGGGGGDGGGGGEFDAQHAGSQIREHYVGVSVILAITVSLVFSFFVLKYGESAHTAGGNN